MLSMEYLIVIVIMLLLSIVLYRVFGGDSNE